MTRISQQALAALPANVRRPDYDRSRLVGGIVHLGVGNFHRAHQAAYVDDALCAGETGWAITGVSLRSPAMRDALAPQDGLYTLIERGDAGDALRVIGAIRDVLVAAEDPGSVVARIADPATRIVTLTITEKGYCRAASGGGLDLRAPEVAHDLADPAHPASAIGMLHAAACARERGGLGGFTVLSCDNLSGNGRIVRALLAEFDDALAAHRGDRGAAARRPIRDWIERELAFPDSMVDRIVPNTSDAHRERVRALCGVDDAWPVATESFSQWVIEDHFAAGRPRWESHGVQFVDDVCDWEAMKLRLLNAAHSCLAYLAVPAGLETVDRAIAEPALRGFIEAMWAREIAPTLPERVRPQVRAYCDALIARFANPALGHRTRQIAIDGSQKLPLRLLPSLRARLAADQPFECLALGIAAWIRFLDGRTESGERYAIDDPMAESLARAAAEAGTKSKSMVGALLRVEAVFGSELGDDPRVVDAIAAQLDRLRACGSVAAAREVAALVGAARSAAGGITGARDTIAR